LVTVDVATSSAVTIGVPPDRRVPSERTNCESPKR